MDNRSVHIIIAIFVVDVVAVVTMVLQCLDISLADGSSHMLYPTSIVSPW